MKTFTLLAVLITVTLLSSCSSSYFASIAPRRYENSIAKVKVKKKKHQEPVQDVMTVSHQNKEALQFIKPISTNYLTCTSIEAPPIDMLKLLPNYAAKSIYKTINHLKHHSTTSTPIISITPQTKRVALMDNNSQSDGGRVALLVIGWVFIVLGILVLLFASIVIGLILTLLGLIFVIAGASMKKNSSQNKEEKKEEKTEYQDVVYLKNGSVIRGMIIEQIPNQSIKVQTKDGSIFVYKMDEVEKITKETSK